MSLQFSTRRASVVRTEDHATTSVPAALVTSSGRRAAARAPLPQQVQRRDVAAQGMRRSPVVAPDITIGANTDEERSIDLMRFLLTQRIIYLGGYVNDKVATQVVGSLLALEAMDENEDIRIYLNSTGGSPYAVIGVVDTIQTIKPDVQIIGLGCCYSYSSMLLASGTKGKRYAMKNTRIMMTQPMGGSQGDIYQIKKTVEELNALYQLTARYYMKFTGMSQDEIEMNTCRDHFMTPEQAMQEGLIDDIIRGEGDYSAPPSLVRQFKDMGWVDGLNSGNLVKGDCT